MKKKAKAFKFGRYTVNIQTGRYSNDRLALELVSARNNESLYVATVNVPEVVLQPNQLLIKNWSENEGILQFLIDNKIVSRSKQLVKVGAGFVSADIVELLETSLETMEPGSKL